MHNFMLPILISCVYEVNECSLVPMENSAMALKSQPTSGNLIWMRSPPTWKIFSHYFDYNGSLCPYHHVCADCAPMLETMMMMLISNIYWILHSFPVIAALSLFQSFDIQMQSFFWWTRFKGEWCKIWRTNSSQSQNKGQHMTKKLWYPPFM